VGPRPGLRSNSTATPFGPCGPEALQDFVFEFCELAGRLPEQDELVGKQPLDKRLELLFRIEMDDDAAAVAAAA